MRKRILSILLTLCMVLCLVPTAVFAEGSPDITGAGTAADPYLIYTAAGLKEFRRRVNAAESGAHAKLMNDIVLNDGTFDEDGNYTKGESGKDAETWEPIHSYSGTFDGNGHTVKGLYVNGEELAGLFSSAGIAYGTVENVAVTGYVSGKNAGGIAGGMLSGIISNCLNYCTVTGSERAGGIAGYSGATIINCGNSGSVSGSVFVGGIAGVSNLAINYCFNTGSVSGSGEQSWVGGIVGSSTTSSRITNCYNTGSVSGFGENHSIGGIAGDSGYNTITNCYNVGQVSNADETDCIGGIVGRQVKGTVNNCYYPTGVADKGIGYTEYSPTVTNTEAKSKAEFADGTVLKLLKQNDTINAWQRECGYLNAAGMTLPLLSWQTADEHTHNKNGNLGGCDCGQLPAGTADDPYLISNAQELKQFRDMVYGGNTGICAKLMNDIVLNDGTFDENGNWSESGTPDRWTPIGDSNHTYAGTFDGGGHTIRGLYVKGASYAGLFGNIYQGTVKNVTVTGYVEGAVNVGGIVGYGSEATITGCTNAATVNGGWTQVGGIVGYLFNGGNVRNCANLGSVRAQIDSEQDEIAYVGGIAGYVKFSATIADCYNAGSIAIQDSGTGYDNKYISSYLGGIIGQILVIGNPCYISNCYSVGSLTCRGSASAEIYGIAGNASMCVISNCYYLTGTANNGGGGEAKSKEEFANGTVLALLKGDRTDSPWADECQYLAAAGMTLPLLSWQTADAHTHDYQWKYDNTEHWKECSCGFIEQDSKAAHSGTDGDCTTAVTCVCGATVKAAETAHNWSAWTQNSGNDTHTHKCQSAGCTASETDNCSGGTATCTEQAACDVCHEKYGNKDPDNHTDTTEWVQTETKHTQKYKCCGAIVVAEENHEWASGVCTECGYGCRHTYEWQSENGQYWQKCKLCDFETGKKDIPTITVTGSDKVCRTQDYSFCFGLPEDATDAEYGYEFNSRADGPLTPTLEDGEYCGILKATIYPAKENSFKLIMTAKTADGFEFRAEKTVTVLDAHTGGTATCKDKAVCEVCGERYGELNANNHANMKHFEAKAATKTAEGNIEYWYCEGCGKYFADKDGLKEITLADTVTAKLPEEKPTSPATGDTSNLTLWIALLFISGGAVTATTVVSKKKRHS